MQFLLSVDSDVAIKWYHGLKKDERKLFFLSRYSAKGDTFSAGKPRLQLQKSLAFVGAQYPYDLAPGGKRFVVVRSAREPGKQEPAPIDSLTVRLNFFDELRRKVPSGKN